MGRHNDLPKVEQVLVIAIRDGHFGPLRVDSDKRSLRDLIDGDNFEQFPVAPGLAIVYGGLAKSRHARPAFRYKDEYFYGPAFLGRHFAGEFTDVSDDDLLVFVERLVVY